VNDSEVEAGGERQRALFVAEACARLTAATESCEFRSRRFWQLRAVQEMNGPHKELRGLCESENEHSGMRGESNILSLVRMNKCTGFGSSPQGALGCASYRGRILQGNLGTAELPSTGWYV
jgi:hypothetical protein